MSVQVAESDPDLWHKTVSVDALTMAWHKVRSNQGGPGGDGIGIREFQKHLFENISQLRRAT